MSGIKGSKDNGSGTVIVISGKAAKAMNGIKGGKDTGTKSVTAGNIALTTVMCIGRGITAGSGTIKTVIWRAAKKMSGIRGTKDGGSAKATTGDGTALTATTGIRDDREHGTKDKTARNFTPTTVMCIGRGITAGSGTASGDSHHPQLQRRSASNFAIFSKASHQTGDPGD